MRIGLDVGREEGERQIERNPKCKDPPSYKRPHFFVGHAYATIAEFHIVLLLSSSQSDPIQGREEGVQAQRGRGETEDDERRWANEGER